MKLSASALLLLALLAPQVRADDTGERFYGGPFDGHAAFDLVRFFVPASLTDRYRGGGYDGHTAADRFLFSIPSSATARFQGSGYDGSTAADRFLFSIPASATVRFLGGDYDGSTVADRFLFSAPASTLARYSGGSYDGHALADLIAFDATMLVARFHGSFYDGHAMADLILYSAPLSASDRFRGGYFDGHDMGTGGPFPNPLDADTDGDGLPDWFEVYFHSITAAVSGLDQDGDGLTTWEEFIAMTNPNDSNSYWRVAGIGTSGTNPVVYFLSSSIRNYSFEYSTNLVTGNWTPYPGQTNRPGIGGPNINSIGSLDSFADATSTGRFYRARVFAP